jgi:CHAT domain-containing protein
MGLILDSPRRFLRRCPWAWALLLLPVAALQDALPGRGQIAFHHALQAMEHGNLARSQQEAEWGYRQFRAADPALAGKFQLLQAEDLLWRGMFGDALRLATAYRPDPSDPAEAIHARVLKALAWTYQQQFASAAQELAPALLLCQQRDYPTCGEVLKTQGTMALAQKRLDDAWQFTSQAYRFSQTHGDRVLEARAALNLGLIALRRSRYDLAQDWSRLAYRDAVALGDEDLALMAMGNIGLAAFPFGDTSASREMFLEAAQTAQRLGDLRNQYTWTEQVGEMNAFVFNYPEAIENFRQLLEIGHQLGDKDALYYANIHMANTLVWSGNPEAAEPFLKQAALAARSGNNREQLLLRYIAALQVVARHRDAQAEELFRGLLRDAGKDEYWRFEAAYQLGGILEREGRRAEAEKHFAAWLAEFEAERAERKDVASYMTFLTYGMPLYSGYIHLLASQGRPQEALAVAERSRARTLVQGLGVAPQKTSLGQNLDPRRVAQKTGATLLCYWLGREQSYLWAVTAQKITLFELPREKAITDRIVRYRKALLGLEDTLGTGNEDGRALYSILVAPAAKLLLPNAPVILLGDGELGALNFETLLAPGKALGQPASTGNHYWIEDVTLRSAPSLTVLAAARPGAQDSGKLLLMGDAVAPNRDYPELVMAPLEMKLIEKHFTAAAQTVYTRLQATPAAYLKGAPERYSYIHFVTHGVASRTDPLDSSIILSPPSQGSDAFKLYASDILQHPIEARLVTISACYGSGARVYAGEGLVGLSWAFLRAGAHNVIGSLWEVSDESSPRLMDNLYQGLQLGMAPDVALRQAKLALLHNASEHFRAPFYWASFQDYSRQ